MTPRVAFGMTLYNNARHLPASLESLLAQTDRDFGLVMVDDASADATEEVARDYVGRDPRLRYVRHATRRGMVPTWRDAYEQARLAFPSARYFAWASDHDWWHPEWLARVRAALESRDDTVLAFALTQRVDGDLRPLDKPPKEFDTSQLADPSARVLAFAGESAGAGDMVYGLVRVPALERAGVFRPVIQPDRLLMVELALAGRFAQVPDVLWLRRQPAQPSVVKQRTTLFADGEAPRGLGLPAWIQHGRVVLREYVFGRRPHPQLGRMGALALLARYQFVYLVRHHNKEGYVLHRLDKTWERWHQDWKEARRASRWAAYRTRMALRPKHIARVAEKYGLHLWRATIYQAAVARRRARAWTYEARMDAQKRYGRLRRAGRKAMYELLMLTHRLGLRGR
jgi:glycosyltransferase involved in cell wall biosynthesis